MISKRSAARHSFYPLSKIKPGSERRAAKIKRLPAYSLQNVEEMVTTETGAVEAEIKNDPITEIDHYYRQILDNLPVAVYTCDTKGFITQYNKAAAALTGWEPLPGKDTWQRLLPDLAEGISATSDTYSIENTLNEGWTARKSKIERNDGTFVHVTVQLSPITDTEYHLIGAAFTLVREAVPDTVYHFFKKPEQKQDTQQQAEELELIRERAEELSKINEQLEKSNHQLERFAYMASHDLQEPLRKIQTFLELSRSNYGDAAAFEKYFAKVHTSAHRMSRLVNEVLNYSRVSMAEVVPEPCDLDKILQDVKIDFELLIEQKNVTITADKLPEVKGVPLQLHQLFTNIISNCIKFCKTSPEIRINATLLSKDELNAYPHLRHAKTYLKLSFADNGIGFDQEYAETIFVLFQRLNSNHDYSGTGIGLALCKKVVENHGGAIAASSKKGDGTTVTVILPYAER
jgi:PAS domain S-box-containing protein